MFRKVVVVTGASRGVGAETAVALGGLGHDVVVNYREKARRAEHVCALARTAGRAVAAQADLTSCDGRQSLLDTAIDSFGRIDALVLNASGGLELGADHGYPMRLNRDAQISLARTAAARMTPGGRIVFVTSHQAHFSRTHPVPGGYAEMAASKLAGEHALREMIGEFAELGLSLSVVSGDMIEGTIVVRLLERKNPSAVDARRQHGPLPTIAEFAGAVAAAVDSDSPSGHTTYVGGADFTSHP